MKRPRTTGTLLLALATAAFGEACSILEPEEIEIRIVNRSERPILYFAWELQSSHLVDLKGSFPIPSNDARVLPPGASRILLPSDVSGEYRREDHLAVFVYEVLDDRAEFRTALTVSPRDLRSSGNRIRVRDLPH